VQPEPQRALSLAVARAFLWRDLLESGRFGSISELAAHLRKDTS
jgi:hypothetical protein